MSSTCRTCTHYTERARFSTSSHEYVRDPYCTHRDHRHLLNVFSPCPDYDNWVDSVVRTHERLRDWCHFELNTGCLSYVLRERPGETECSHVGLRQRFGRGLNANGRLLQQFMAQTEALILELRSLNPDVPVGNRRQEVWRMRRGLIEFSRSGPAWLFTWVCQQLNLTVEETRTGNHG